MKRTISLVVLLTICICALVCLTACEHKHNLSDWQTDAENHWHVCLDEKCSSITDKGAHTGGTATCTKQAWCAVCGEAYGELLAHDFTDATCSEPARCTVCGKKQGTTLEHDYTDVDWSFDATHHWKECTKGCAPEREKHTYTEAVSAEHLISAATCQSPAVYYKSCECGARGTETFAHGAPLQHSYTDAAWSFDGTHPAKICGICSKIFADGSGALETYDEYVYDGTFEGDFDFTVTYNQSQADFYGVDALLSSGWRTGNIVFHETGNLAENIFIRQDWNAYIGSGTTKILYQNSASLDDIQAAFAGLSAAAYGNATTFAGSDANAARIFRNASVTVRCVRVGDTVTVYQQICEPGTSDAVIFNVYKFTTTIESLSFRVVGAGCGITMTHDTYATSKVQLSGDALLRTATYGLATYSYANPANTRAHMALSFKVPAGTTITYTGPDTYRWAVIRLSEYLGEFDGANHADARLEDAGWTAKGTKSYTVTADSYIAINLRYDSNASMTSLNLREIFSKYFRIGFALSDNLNSRTEAFTPDMLTTDNSFYGYAVYSGNWSDTVVDRCHVVLVPFVKKGTTISFTGGAAYKYSVLELANERVVLVDTGWKNHDATYTVTQDCYIAVNVRLDTNGSLADTDIYKLLYENVVINGQCAFTTYDNPITEIESIYAGLPGGVNHRGHGTAPENTVSAYAESKNQGFTYVECDVSFTKDGYGVLLHDNTIDRTSNGTGNINSITFANARTYDFGAWKSAEYEGELIASFEEFIIQCQNLSLHPYIELKNGNKNQIHRLAMVVKRYGMENDVTWISFNAACLQYIDEVLPSSRLGYVSGSNDTLAVIDTALSLKTDTNEVFLDLNSSLVDAFGENSYVALAKENGLQIEVWTVDSASLMQTIYKASSGYITRFTSNNTNAEEVEF